MSFVVKLWDTSGNVTFDSDLAVGGVCLGFYTVPSGGGEITFPSYTGSVVGIGIATGALTTNGVTTDYTSDTSTYGYLRFSFPAYLAGATYTLFAK